jgi:hypothetical protein
MQFRLKCRTISTAGALLILAASGCSSHHTEPSSPAPGAAAPMSVPNSAMLPADARQVGVSSKELRFKPDNDGVIYMTDETISRIVLRKRLRAGQVFDFSVRSGLARIDSQTVYQQSSSNGHQFKLYFEKE